MKTLLFTTLLAGLMSLPCSANNNVYYKWVDENGQTHYGETPPAQTESQKVKVQTGHSEPTVYGGVDSSKNKGEQDQAKDMAQTEQSVRDPETCKRAKKNLSVLNGRPRIRVTDEQGVYRFLTIDEINDSRDKMLTLIQENC
jgi:hypothetical protein